MDSPSYGKSIRIGDRELHVCGDREYVDVEFEKLRNLVFGTSEGLQKLEEEKAACGNGVAKEISLREFLNNAKGRKKTDHLALVGYYLEKYLSQETYTMDELVRKASESKVPLGRNLHRDVGKLIEAGKLEKFGKKGGSDAFRLTLQGETYVEKELGGGS